MAEAAPNPNKVQRAQDKLALAEALKGTGGSVKARGVERANATLAAAGVEAGGGDAYNALANIAKKGAVGGKRAQYLSQLMQLGLVNENEELVTSRGQDDVARAYQSMSEGFAGTLGADVEAGSPAVLDAVRRYVEGRSSDTTRFLSGVKETANLQRQAIIAGQIGPTLDATGQLIESLKMLEEEEDLLAQAQKGQLLGMAGYALGGPEMSAALGGAFGGRAGMSSALNTRLATDGKAAEAFGNILPMFGG